MIVELYILPFLNKIQILLTVFCMIFSLVSCEQEGWIDEKDQTIKQSENVMEKYYNPQNALKSIYEIVTNVYSNQELDDIVNSKLHIDDLNSKYPIECMRKGNEGNGDEYVVSYLGDSHYVSVSFNQDGGFAFAEKVLKSNLSLNAYLLIDTGSSLDYVKELDQYGDYTYTKHITSGVYDVLTSVHYSKDGYVINIIYDEELKVLDVLYALI